MAFKDYSTNPNANTELGDGTYIGPDMFRSDVRPALQQIAADGKALAADLEGVVALGKGDPGGTPQAIGLFIAASSLEIPNGIDVVATTGYSTLDVGPALYVKDASVDTTYVAAHPRASFRSTNGYGFRLSYEQTLTPQMLGAAADGVTNDTAAFQAAIDALPAVGGTILVPLATYSLTTTPTVGSRAITWIVEEGTVFTGAGAAGGAFPTVRLTGNVLSIAAVLGQLAAGSTNVNVSSGTGIGHASGTTQLYYDVSRVYGVSGPFDYVRQAYHGTHIQTTSTVTNADGLHQYVWGETSASIANGAGIASHLRLDAGADVTNEFDCFNVPSATYGVGATGQRVAGLRVGVIGDPAKVQEAIGVYVVDQSAVGFVQAFRSELTAGSNKYAIASLGSAQSVHLGKFKIGATSVPAEALDVTGNILGDQEITTKGAFRIGYTAGAGQSVIQATSKSTTVAINKPTGDITLNNAALASNTTVTFTVTNTVIASTDVVIVNLKSGNATAGTYQVWPEAIATGSFKINVRNISGGSLSEALVLNFAIIKGSNT